MTEKIELTAIIMYKFLKENEYSDERNGQCKKKKQNGIYRNKNKLSKVNILLDRISSILDLH